jgi:hypothetical protein
MGRFGGRSSEKAGARDHAQVIGMDGALISIDENYDPIEGGNIISLDAARQTKSWPGVDPARSAASVKAAQTRKSNLERNRFEGAKRETMNQFAGIHGRIAEGYARAREEQNKPKTDAKGNVLQNGKVYTKSGTLVYAGGVYYPKGIFGAKKSAYFVCQSVAFKGDRLIAAGDLERPDYAVTAGKWFYCEDLVSAPTGAQTTMRSGKGLI